jgi:hypothetical protein
MTSTFVTVKTLVCAVPVKEVMVAVTDLVLRDVEFGRPVSCLLLSSVSAEPLIDQPCSHLQLRG